VLSPHGARGPIRSTEDDRDVELAGRHVPELGSRIDDVIDGLHREIERHELHNGHQTRHGHSDAQSGESGLSDGCVHNSLTAILLHEALGNLPFKEEEEEKTQWEDEKFAVGQWEVGFVCAL